MKTKIVWNGCDGYVEADEAARRGYDFDGEKLYHGNQEYVAFEVEEVDQSLEDYDEYYLTETGSVYK